MAGTDFSHLTNDELINGIQALNLPDYIRSKGHGIDVRETLAQMTEMTIQLGINMGLSPEDALAWARKLQDIDAQLAQKMYKGRGEVTSADLSQEVKEQMTGGSVAVIGKNSVLEENIVDKQVTLPKLSPLVEKEIYTKTLLKNIVPDSYFRRAINTTWYALDKKSNDTITFENGVFTHKSSSLTDSSRVRLRASISLIAGHKYFISFEVKNNNSTNFTATNAIILSGSTQKHITETSRELDGIDAPGVWHKKINSTNNYYVADGTETTLEFLSSNAPLGEGLSYRKPLLIDVTEVYDIGNEPSFEEFKNFISSYPNEWFEEYSSSLARTLGEFSEILADENEEWRV